MKKLTSRKGIIIIIIPLFAVFLQFFLRKVLDHDFNTIGITLAALGLGQILPFFYFDHFVANKILGISPEYNYSENKFSVVYQLKNNIPIEEIESVKNLFVIAVFVNLALFLVTLYCGLEGLIILHTIFGAICCFISWFLIVFK